MTDFKIITTCLKLSIDLNLIASFSKCGLIVEIFMTGGSGVEDPKTSLISSTRRAFRMVFICLGLR